MLKRVKYRLKQGMQFFFGKYKKEWDLEIKNILTKDEFKIFENMIEYDKLHSYILFTYVKDDKLLKNDINYQKLALLHDCGKGDLSFYKRVKNVIFSEKESIHHSEKSYEMLKLINKNLAILAREHHSLQQNTKMTRFQQLDDN